MNYAIILDEPELDRFIAALPEITDQEAFYCCLFGRHKYCPAFPNTKDSGQLARFVVRKSELKEKLRRLECPVGAFVRDGTAAPQEALAVYMGMNPRNLVKANKSLLIELANRIASGDLNFNPITVATTEVHRATDRKFFVDFDYDDADYKDYLPQIQAVLPADAYRILKTRGGFHLLVELAKTPLKTAWYKILAALPKCDVRGANNLTPVPGCTQGGFVPRLIVHPPPVEGSPTLYLQHWNS